MGRSRRHLWRWNRMGGVTPLKKVTIVKKHTAPFKRHQWNRHSKLSHVVTWRKPKGIDSRVRRRFKGTLRMVNIGYGNNKETRHVLPNGFKKYQVSTVKDLDVLLMQNRKYAVEIASGVGARKRAAIVERAAQMNIKVLNGSSSLMTEQDE